MLFKILLTYHIQHQHLHIVECVGIGMAAILTQLLGESLDNALNTIGFGVDTLVIVDANNGLGRILFV